MFYEDLCQDSPQDFKRATGVSPALFAEMLLTLEQAKGNGSMWNANDWVGTKPQKALRASRTQK